MERKTAKYTLSDIYLKITVSLSLLLFALSFTQSAFYTGNPESPEISSAFLFAFGWSAFLAGEYLKLLIWLANPLYIFAIVMCGFNRRYTIVSAIAALLLSLYFLTIETFATSELGTGPYYTIESLGNGYWLWLSSIAVLAIGSVLSYFNDKKVFQ